MKRFASLLAAALVLLTTAEAARASDLASLHYGGYQPWWNIFAKKNKCMTPEEVRLQRFWHDYYDAMRRYYGALDRIDWVAYYKNHGYQINSNCAYGQYGQCGPYGQSGPQMIQFAPVFVSPQMQWAVPNGCLSGPPTGGGMGGMGMPGYGYGQ